MKRYWLIALVVLWVMTAPAVLLSQKTPILCCRDVCKCGPESRLCDRMDADKCDTFKGWEVSDCSECYWGKGSE